jgi:hypothetical protein
MSKLELVADGTDDGGGRLCQRLMFLLMLDRGVLRILRFFHNVLNIKRHFIA